TVWGTRLRGAYGVSDHLELGGELGFSTSSAVHFSNAMVSGLRGDLYGDLYAFEVAPSARLVGPALMHAGSSVLLRPLLDVRAGLLMRSVASQLALDTQQRLIDRPSTDTSALAFMGATAGLEWRFADVYAIGVAGDVVYAGNRYTGFGIAVEISLLRFP